MGPTKTPIGHCRVSREDWGEWIRINQDLAGADYETFSEQLRRFCDDVAERGERAVVVDVKPADFLAWCRKSGRNVDADARALYASVKIAEMEHGRVHE